MVTFCEIRRCYRSLLVHRLRSFLSSLGILFGVAAVIAMLSIGEGAKQEALEQITQLGMNSIIIRQNVLSGDQKGSKDHSKGLSWEDVEAIRSNLSSLAYDAPIKEIKEGVSNSIDHFVPEFLAVTRQFGEMKNLQLSEGRFICDLDLKEKKRVCVLGYEIAKKMGSYGHIGHPFHYEKNQFEIVGVLKPIYWQKNKNQVITRHDLDKTIFIPLINRNDFLTEIILQIKEASQLEKSMQLVKKILKKRHGDDEDYHIIIPHELIQQAYRTQKMFNWILGSIAAISLLVGGIGIMNIMLATVSERTKEIGIRRAVGANQRHILLQFLLEALFLTLGGAIFGVVLGIAIAILINHIAEWKTIVTPWSLIMALSLSSVIGIGAGIYPAIQAAKKDPIRALRDEI